MYTKIKKDDVILQMKSGHFSQNNGSQASQALNSMSAKSVADSQCSFSLASPDIEQGQVPMQFKESPESTKPQPGSGQFIQRKTNETGLPDNLKNGLENLSGYSMDDVKVHYNSNKPAQLQAHAYAEGTNIHLGPGQEQHLPHEAWHVVQQKQGRVEPTMQLKGRIGVNNDIGLEREADIMGMKAQDIGVCFTTGETKTGVIQNQRGEGDTVPYTSDQRITKPLVQRRLANHTIDTNWKTNLATLFNTHQNKIYIGQLRQSALNLEDRHLDDMYNEALQYIESSRTGRLILNKIRLWDQDVTITIGGLAPTKAHIDPGTNGPVNITWNPFTFFGVWMTDNTNHVTEGGVMSPAAILLHELGHVCQHIDDLEGYVKLITATAGDPAYKVFSEYNYENRNKNQLTPWFIEHHNLARNETPFNKEQGEPIRSKYGNSSAQLDVETDLNGWPNRTISSAFRARARYIRNNGWVNAVTHHTNIPRNNRPDARLNYENYKRDITDTIENPILRVNSVYDFLEIITERIERSTTLGEASSAMSDMRNYLNDTKGLRLPREAKRQIVIDMNRLIRELKRKFGQTNWRVTRLETALTAWEGERDLY